MLKINQLTVRYGELVAVKDITLDVKEGEFVSIVGSNGAGKTTLVNAISGLISNKTGKILFKGMPIANAPSNKIVGAGLIQVPEGRKIFSNLSVYENLRLGSYLPKAKAKRKEMFKTILEYFPILGERKDQLAGSLSGGEQQMLAIGRALMGLPDLIIFDEPSLGLSPLINSNIFEIIAKINQAGTTILLIEQNTYLALNSSKRSYVIENGSIVLEGPSQELINNPYVIEAYLGV